MQSNRKADNVILTERVSINTRKLYSLGTSARTPNISMWYHLSLKSRIALRRVWNGIVEKQILNHQALEDCQPNSLVGFSLDDCKQIWSRLENMNLVQWMVTWNGSTTLPASLMEEQAFKSYTRQYKNDNHGPLEHVQEHQPRGSMTVDRHSSDEVEFEDDVETNDKKAQSPSIVDFSNDWGVSEGPSLITDVSKQFVRKSDKSKYQTVSSGYAMLAAHVFIQNKLIRSCPQDDNLPKLLIIGQKGSGKATLCRLCAGWVGAHVHELNLKTIHRDVMAEKGYESGQYLDEMLQTKISSIFATAMEARPAIVLIQDVERVFITNSDRDKESPVAKLARRLKQFLFEQIEKSEGIEKLIIVATSSYPDDCVGKDHQEFRNFFHTIVHLPLPSHRSRAMKIRQALGKFNNINEDQEDEVSKWVLITASADDIVGCTWRDIDHSMQQACGALPDNATLTQALQLFKFYATSTRDREHINKRHVALIDWLCLALPGQSPKQSKQQIKRHL
jgi:SpoVK/Ycf46/Vps4 family AAA+-type ATPase